MKKKCNEPEPGFSRFKKMLLAMRLTLFLMILAVFSTSAATYGQRTKLDLNIKDMQIREILNQIEDQTEYSFMYDNNQLDVSKKVSVDVKSSTIENILAEIFKESGVIYKIIDRHIMLYPKEQTIAVQQPRNVSGKVADSSGQPLLGVSVVIKGTTVGTVTDFEGNYFLANVSANATLVYSFVGMKVQEIPMNSRGIIDVAMVEDVIGIEEVVAIGYGTVKKSDLTGAVASVKSEELRTGAQSSVDQFLQGRIPGVQVTTANSDPGGAYTIRIRGTNSITAGNEPLYVIDGLPTDPINALNPGDIESVEVLKDASAAAIYGSRGANGVILITTKKGKKGALEVEYDGYVGIQKVAKKLDLLNGEEYMKFVNDLQEDMGQSPTFSDSEITAIGDGTDWQDELFQTASIQNHNLSLSGGSEDTQYFISGNYLDQTGIVPNTDFKRYSGKMNIIHSFGRLNFGVNLNSSIVKDNTVRKLGINMTAGIIPSTLQMDPIMKVRDEDGNYTKSTKLDLNNPVALAKTEMHTSEWDRTLGNVFAEYDITNSLQAKVNFGVDRRRGRGDDYLTKETTLGSQRNGSAEASNTINTSYLVEYTLNYRKELENHSITALAGYSYQEFINRGFGAYVENFPTDAFQTDNLAAGDPDKVSISSYKNKNQLLSWFGRGKYSYKNKYLVTASIRADGSSRFGEDNKFGYFPSFALAWRASDEHFISDMGIFSQLKVRVSYGLIGNQEIGNYNSLVLLGTSDEAVFDGQRFVSIVPTQLANPDLKWETTEQYNIGLDFGFLGDRITGTLDLFKKNTYNLLLNLPIPTTSGFSTSLQNVGDTKNKGIEFMIDSKNLIGRFKWSTIFNIATVKNEVSNLGELPFILTGSFRYLDNLSILTVGEPINSYYGYIADGIFQSQDEITGSAQPNAKPGDIRFRDISADGKIDPDDRTIIGDPFPDFTFGLTNDFSYGRLGLNVFIEGSYGNDMFHVTRVDSENPIEFLRNRQRYVLDRWTTQNPTGKNPSFITNDVSKAMNSRVIEDASYLRLKYLRIHYDFPQPRWNFISSLSVYAVAHNLFTITNYTGYNPDVSVLGSNNFRADYYNHPLARMFTFGINVKFR